MSSHKNMVYMISGFNIFRGICFPVQKALLDHAHKSRVGAVSKSWFCALKAFNLVSLLKQPTSQYLLCPQSDGISTVWLGSPLPGYMVTFALAAHIDPEVLYWWTYTAYFPPSAYSLMVMVSGPPVEPPLCKRKIHFQLWLRSSSISRWFHTWLSLSNVFWPQAFLLYLMSQFWLLGMYKSKSFG